jgi:hypothetical protein
VTVPPPFDPEVHLDVVAPALGLSIDPAWRPGVVANLAVAAAMAALLDAFPPGDAIEPATVFEADR